MRMAVSYNKWFPIGRVTDAVVLHGHDDFPAYLKRGMAAYLTATESVWRKYVKCRHVVVVLHINVTFKEPKLIFN